MPKEVVLQQCDYCRKTAKRVSTIEHHEKICINNPNGINCFLCVHQEYGIFYIDRWDGGQDEKELYFCTEYEVPCNRDMALECDRFERGQRGFSPQE